MSKKDEALKLALEALEWINRVNAMGYEYKQKARESLNAIYEALAEQQTDWEAVAADQAMTIALLRAEQPAQQEPEFFTHCVDQPYDWSEWVCPDPKGYLMKCCDCGLVHEAEFGVVRYKSETEREDCDMVDDPNLQAVFRMRRSEQWSPADMAHRAGGLTMEQPAQQEPVAWMHPDEYKTYFTTDPSEDLLLNDYWTPLYTSPPQRKPLTDEEIESINVKFAGSRDLARLFARAIEAAHGIKENT